eukprot:9661630-Ditylum_brightwellii.AAC.1
MAVVLLQQLIVVFAKNMLLGLFSSLPSALIMLQGVAGNGLRNTIESMLILGFQSNPGLGTFLEQMRTSSIHRRTHQI